MATEKQKNAVGNIVENRGNVSKGMRDAGYAEATAKNPKNLTNSKGWQELLDEYLPDDLLMKVGNEGLQATRSIGEGENKGEAPDFAVRHRYFDTALKLKNKYPSAKLDLTTAGEKIIGINMIAPEGEVKEK